MLSRVTDCSAEVRKSALNAIELGFTIKSLDGHAIGVVCKRLKDMDFGVKAKCTDLICKRWMRDCSLTELLSRLDDGTRNDIGKELVETVTHSLDPFWSAELLRDIFTAYCFTFLFLLFLT